MFDWIRRKVKNAVLAGFADAAEELAGQGANGNEDAQDRLNQALGLLPSPVDTEVVQKRRRAI